ncbi:MAG: glycosyltransferase [Patescibacteria group bacterium]
MKFGVIGSIAKPTHSEAMGGIEVWTALFLLESIKRGHVFDLFALKGSIEVTNQIRLIEVLKKGLDVIKNNPFFKSKSKLSGEHNGMLLMDVSFSRMMVLLKEKQQDYDIVINNSASPLFTVNWDLYQKPLLNIGHFSAAEPYVSYFDYFPLPPHCFFVFPSRREYELAARVPDQQKFHIPHGIDISKIPFEAGTGKNMLWVGRLDPVARKGAPEAIAISNKMEIPINVYTYIEDTHYFDTAVKPLFTAYTHFQTNIPRTEYFKDAKLFLFPLQWEEPFGFTIVEAMASGTPVVAYAKGAIPEIIKDGETGFIVNASEDDRRGNWMITKTGEEGMFEAVERIYSLPLERYQAMRRACREHVERSFTVEKMVDGYEKAYSAILER